MPQVYLDETWINSHAAPERIWVDEDGMGGWKRPSGKGERLIIVHAGTALGWVPECGKWFKSKTKSANYHDEMNAQHVCTCHYVSVSFDHVCLCCQCTV